MISDGLVQATPQQYGEPHALEQDLHQVVRGEVRFDEGSRALYSTDASNYRQLPIGVVIPLDEEDIVAAVAACRRHAAPILMRGAGTSLAGQACNVAVVLDTTKHFKQILEIDAVRRLARIEPGVVLDELRAALAPHGLTFGPDPSSHSRCTLGGMIGNNSCGVHSVMAGKTAENIETLDILTYDGVRMQLGATSEAALQTIIQNGGRQGEIYAGLKALRDRYTAHINAGFPAIPRRVSGYNLDQLLEQNGFNVARALVGSEGTCAIILGATVRLIPDPPARVLLVIAYPDIYLAGDQTPVVLRHLPIGLEGLDQGMIEAMRRKNLQLDDIVLLPHGGAWLLVEFGGATSLEAEHSARGLMTELDSQGVASAMELFVDPKAQRKVWAIRESGAAATNAVPGERNTYPGWEDAAVDPARIGDYLRDFRALLDSYGYQAALYGHFGDGCVHARIDFDLSNAAGISNWRAFLMDAADLVVRFGGSLSGEHGDGQAKGELLPRMFGPELMRALVEFKAIWDPDNRMNPGKLIHAYALDANLRTGPEYRPLEPATYFSFARDEGSFAKAAGRCVGFAKCRRAEGGAMCPSYRATHEEKYVTRGRARLLFEMLQGEVLRDGWRNEQIKEALELCLSCKSCKAECPVQVDMATYKAEFLAHYYEGKLRPRQAYTMGLIHHWAQVATRAPRLINLMAGLPGLRSAIKWVAGIASPRQLPRFAPKSFRQQFECRTLPESGREVLLWTDTFTNNFQPEIAMAAVDVLEAAGFRVGIPRHGLCCGRPLFDFGMLERAKQQLQEILDALADEIARGVPVIGLEPACVSVFRDELLNLFPQDSAAARLARQTFTLNEFLVQQDFQPPPLYRKAVVHGHCHHKAVLGMHHEMEMLQRMQLDVTLLDSGCCGMAGTFGMHRRHYHTSMRIGEAVLLPALRNLLEDELIVADGFSCREQIIHGTGLRPLHSAQVLQLALSQATFLVNS